MNWVHKLPRNLKELEPLDDLLQILEESLVEEPPISIKDGGLFKNGFNAQLDEYLEASKMKTWLAELQAGNVNVQVLSH